MPQTSTTSQHATERVLVDLQCRFMDLELLVSELNDVITDLGAQLLDRERAGRAMMRRIEQLEASSPQRLNDG